MREPVVLSAVSDVLGLAARPDPSDNFFDLGGSSLAAIQLVLRLEREVGIRLSPRTVLAGDTLADLISELDQAASETAASSAEAAADASLGEITDASPPDDEDGRPSMAQQWALDSGRSEPDGTALQFQVGYLVTGPLDVEVLDRALNAVCEHHRELLVAFVRPDTKDRVVQVATGVTIERHQFPFNGQALALDLLTTAARVPFDRGCGARIRVVVASCGSDRHYLMLGFDHLAADGWSLNLVVEDLSTAYTQLRAGQVVQLPASGDYRHYSRRQWTAAPERLQTLGRYWRSQLPERYEDLSVVLPGYRGPGPLRDPQTIELPASTKVGDALAVAGAMTRQSSFMLAAAAMSVLVSRWTGRSEVRLLTSCANRSSSGCARTVGWFANGVYPTFSLAPQTTFADFTSQVASQLSDAMQHGDLPASYIRREVWPAAPAGYRKDTGIYFACNDAWGESLALPDCTVEVVELPDAADAPGLQFYLFREATGWVLRVMFHASEYDPSTPRELGEQLLHLLENVEDILTSSLLELCSVETATAAAR